jgi:hypothetical protein
MRLKISLSVALFVLFFFSMLAPMSNSALAPTAAGAVIPKAVAAPALAYMPEPYITVTMFMLDDDGNSTGKLCTEFPGNWGCTAFCTDSSQCQEHDLGPFPYPYDGSTIVVPIQTYYLLDVLSQEMSPDVVTQSQALRAQAVTARSFAWWHVDNTILSGWLPSINNSTGYQVFVPHRYDALFPRYLPLEPTVPDPCDPLIPHSPPQQRACAAVAPRYYMSMWYKDAPIFAAYSGDIKNETLTYPPATPPHPELVGVKEPISTACNAGTSGNPYGMSGNGAMRWARGHECSYVNATPAPGNAPGGPWSVIWTRPEQILFHYFTNVHLRDADHANAVLSPDWRWNPLDLRWNGNSPQPPTMQPGGSYLVNVTLQNTGIAEWLCQDSAPMPPSFAQFQLGYWWSKGPARLAGTGRAVLCNVAPGQSVTVPLTINDIPNWGAGAYTLQLDVYDRQRAIWFSQNGDATHRLAWPTYNVNVQVTTLPTPSPSPTSCGFDGC